MALNHRQELFAQEYIVDLNATQAAIRAGYSEAVAKGYYVYFLIDPRSGSIFYIGKGKGGRCAQHVKSTKAGRIDNGAKCRKIAEIISSGAEILEFIFESGLDEDDAYRLERKLIRALRDYGLTNITSGTVSTAEASRLHSEILLSRLKSFDDWALSMPMAAIDWMERSGYSAKSFYTQFKNALTDCAGGKWPSEVVVVTKGSGNG